MCGSNLSPCICLRAFWSGFAQRLGFQTSDFFAAPSHVCLVGFFAQCLGFKLQIFFRSTFTCLSPVWVQSVTLYLFKGRLFGRVLFKFHTFSSFCKTCDKYCVDPICHLFVLFKFHTFSSFCNTCDKHVWIQSVTYLLKHACLVGSFCPMFGGTNFILFLPLFFFFFFFQHLQREPPELRCHRRRERGLQPHAAMWKVNRVD